MNRRRRLWLICENGCFIAIHHLTTLDSSQVIWGRTTTTPHHTNPNRPDRAHKIRNILATLRLLQHSTGLVPVKPLPLPLSCEWTAIEGDACDCELSSWSHRQQSTKCHKLLSPRINE